MIKGNITANRKCQFKIPSWHQDHQLISNQTNGNVKTNTLIINYRAAENGHTVVTLLKKQEMLHILTIAIRQTLLACIGDLK